MQLNLLTWWVVLWFLLNFTPFFKVSARSSMQCYLMIDHYIASWCLMIDSIAEWFFSFPEISNSSSLVQRNIFHFLLSHLEQWACFLEINERKITFCNTTLLLNGFSYRESSWSNAVSMSFIDVLISLQSNNADSNHIFLWFYVIMQAKKSYKSLLVECLDH